MKSYTLTPKEREEEHTHTERALEEIINTEDTKLTYSSKNSGILTIESSVDHHELETLFPDYHIEEETDYDIGHK